MKNEINFKIIILILCQLYFRKYIQKVGIAYALNNKYTYPTLVSMTSILENSSSQTYYIFYLLVNKKTFKNENKKTLINIKTKYYRCDVKIIELTNENLKNANIKRYPFAAYYRLFLAELIPELNRIIYLDGDTLIYKDLREMYNLNMRNNIILGFVDNSYKKAELFGEITYKYIVSGVLLINLKKMRRENITQKFIEFINNYEDKLIQEDQTIINIVLKGRIDFLPAKFGIWNFRSKKSVLKHNYYGNKTLGIKAYDEKEILDAWKSPSIIHFVRAKPWNKTLTKPYIKYKKKWWKYARLTDEYKKIIYSYKKLNNLNTSYEYI